jgi:DNA polymerase-3 subunit delta
MSIHHTHHPLKSTYLFVGQETFLIEEQLSSIRTSLGENASLNYAAFNAEDGLHAEEIVALCNTMPFLSERRLIVVRNIHKPSAKHVEPLLRYVENPSDFTTLIMTIEGQKEDKQISKHLAKTVHVLRFDPLKGAGLIDWIQPRAKLYSKKMDKDAAFLLADITVSNTWFIATELEKLSLYAGPRETITLKDVEFLVMRSHEPSIFAFMDSLFDRKKDAIFRLHELETSGIPELEIISRIENATIQHYQILFGKQGKKRGVHPFVEKKISSRKSLWRASQLISLLREIRALEQSLKSGRSFQIWVALSEAITPFTISDRTRQAGRL